MNVLAKDNDQQKIAVLGATSHIARGLIENFAGTSGYKLFLYARSIDKVHAFLESSQIHTIGAVNNFEHFPSTDFDAIINCIGIGQPEKLKKAGFNIFKITEEFDNLVINYLIKNPKCLYINLSSGAVYGKDFTCSVNIDSVSNIEVNNLLPEDAYRIAKIHSEAKHRSLQHLNIVDLRIFSYFSHHIDLGAKFLLSEIISSIKNNDVLSTTETNIVRDYIHPLDLHELVSLCINKSKINDAFDVYSKKPITKFALLDFFASNYQFKYKIEDSLVENSPTGVKNVYYSKNHKAREIGYTPKYTSIEAISDEYSKIIKERL